MQDLRKHWQLAHIDDFRSVQQFLNKDEILAPQAAHERPTSTRPELLPLDIWMKR